MKNIYLQLLSLCVIALALTSCILEKEPEIPTGANNILAPGFLSSEIAIVSDTIVQTTTQLDSPGNLNILHHGWVWGKTMNPTLADQSLDSGELAVLAFSAEITGLEWGEVYYLRPYLSTASDTIYGTDTCTFLGVGFTPNTGANVFAGSEIQFINDSPDNCTCEWHFGDGGTSVAFSPNHTYEDTGIRTVQLIASNNGCKVSKTMTLTILPNPFTDYWVSIPGGTFMMGCTPEQDPETDCDTDENPVHEVTIEPFLMGKTEITQGQWLSVMGENPSIFQSCGLDCPVENVSWNDAHIFIDKLNATLPPGAKPYRLPTEAEWEYAARGNQPYKYPGHPDRDSVAWNMDNSGDSTHPVAKKLINGFGLYDMGGNVYEYVEDDYHYDEDSDTGYIDAPIDGSAWIDSPRAGDRVIRGGGWSFDPTNCRTANRAANTPGEKGNIYGFRLARSF